MIAPLVPIAISHEDIRRPISGYGPETVKPRLHEAVLDVQGATVLTVRIHYITYVILPYVCRTLTSFVTKINYAS